ncbi:hypothetical protein [Promineifilum sp.]|uniref:hypothetical protein n=1 Tax=Promineifilum sp. TaxID=2664178 RepID=UPI0035ADD2C6
MLETEAIHTVVKMMEMLSEATQNRVVEHLRDYLAELDDEAEWDAEFEQTQEQLIAAASRARQEIHEGKAEPMDFERL